MDWYRTYHGAVTDPKWAVIAKRAVTQCNAPSVSPSDVWSVWSYQMDHASQNTPRGSVEGVELDVAASALGLDESVVRAIDAVMRERGMITEENVVAAWEKRNPKREDDSSDRVKAYRERKRSVTQGNAVKRGVTQSNARGEESRGDKKEQSSGSNEPGASSAKSFQQVGGKPAAALAGDVLNSIEFALGTEASPGRLMQIIRDGDPEAGIPRGLYGDSKKPPGDRTEGQDFNTLKAWLNAGKSPTDLECQILGLAMLRDAGQLGDFAPGTSLSLGMFAVVKNLPQRATTYFLRNAKPKTRSA